MVTLFIVRIGTPVTVRLVFHVLERHVLLLAWNLGRELLGGTFMEVYLIKFREYYIIV